MRQKVIRIQVGFARAMVSGLLAGFVLAGLLSVSCGKDAGEQRLEPFRIENLQLTEYGLEAFGGEPVRVYGEGFQAGDQVVLSAVGGAPANYILALSEVTSEYVEFSLPEQIRSGEYRFSVARGGESHELGRVDVRILSRFPEIPDKAGMDIKGYVRCGESPLAGVVVTDGYSVTRTDAAGVYYLSRHGSAQFVIISLPSGYEANTVDNIPEYFRRLASVKDGVERHDFCLRQVDNRRHVVITPADLHLANRFNRQDIVWFRNGFVADVNALIASYRVRGIQPYVLTLGDLSSDARMEMPGWTRTGFDDSAWQEPELVEPPCFLIRSQMNENICVMDTLRPVSVTEPQPGVYVVDMGQNMVGWLRMRVEGKAGEQVKLRYAELLRPDGTLYMDNYREARVTDLYTLRGGGPEVWEPTFSYRGFRYAEITGYPGRLTAADLLGKVLYDRMETTGSLETSNSTINRVHRNAYWGIRGNYRSMPTDCPQRNERMGWLGDRSVNCHGESFLFDNNGLYAKWMEDIAASQLADGRISDVAPDYFTRLYYDSMTWPGTYLSVAEMLYRQFGNTGPIRKHYLSMKQWIEYMENNYMQDDLLPHDRYGDWCMPPESPELIHSKDPARITAPAVLGTTYFYYYLNMMKEFAALLGKNQDAEEFGLQAQRTCDAFNARFFNERERCYDNNTITANLLPLRFGMVPEKYRADVFRNIVDKTMKEWNGHISTGVVGTQWIMRGLSDNGRPDIALRLATNRDYPSWGYMVENGATTIWELWNGNTADPSMNSLNHVMLLGDLLVWDYEYLGGIRNAPGSAGFKQILMRPLTQVGLEYVKASYNSVYGRIASSWRHTKQGFSWDVTVPCNTQATLYIPASAADRVHEGGRKADGCEGVRFIRMEDGCAVFEVGSGNYSFSVPR